MNISKVEKRQNKLLNIHELTSNARLPNSTLITSVVYAFAVGEILLY